MSLVQNVWERPLLCASCGAPLTPDPQGGYATCEYCGLRSAPAGTRAGSELEADLQQVEEWWHRERQRFMTADRRGNLHPPEEEKVSHVVWMVVGMALGLGSALAGHQWNWTLAGIAGFFLFPILITLPAALYHQRNEQRHKEYQRVEAEYKGRRNAIIERHARRP
jgi:hypothetical protein